MIFDIDPAPLRMVLFDFGNVLAPIDHRRFARLMTERDDRGIERLTRRLFGPDTPGQRFETGLITPQEFREQATGILGVHPSIEAFDAAFNEIIKPPFPEMLELVIALSPFYRIGMLSNTNSIHFEQSIRKLPFFERFNQITLSYEVGTMKPGEAIFQDAFSKHPGSPVSILYLDDILQFVDAARGQGMQGFHVENPAKAAVKIRQLLLPPTRENVSPEPESEE
ncbi:MAG: HAD family phosphatase [Candidatus Ozemobacteraceae bacterium]